MNQISAPMVAEGSATRQELEKIPSLAALLPHLQRAHTAIFAMGVQPPDPQLRPLVEREAALDAEHDDIVRWAIEFLVRYVVDQKLDTSSLGQRRAELVKALSKEIDPASNFGSPYEWTAFCDRLLPLFLPGTPSQHTDGKAG